MKHIVQETKKKFKDCHFLAQNFHIQILYQLEEKVVDLPKPIVKWFKSNLDNFDLLDTGLENVQLFVEDTCPLLGSNSGHLPLDLRVIVNRFVMGSLKKEAPE